MCAGVVETLLPLRGAHGVGEGAAPGHYCDSSCTNAHERGEPASQPRRQGEAAAKLDDGDTARLAHRFVSASCASSATATAGAQLATDSWSDPARAIRRPKSR